MVLFHKLKTSEFMNRIRPHYSYSGPAVIEGCLPCSIPSVEIRIYYIRFAGLPASLYRAIIILPRLYGGSVLITFYLHKNGGGVKSQIL